MWVATISIDNKNYFVIKIYLLYHSYDHNYLHYIRFSPLILIGFANVTRTNNFCKCTHWSPLSKKQSAECFFFFLKLSIALQCISKITSLLAAKLQVIGPFFIEYYDWPLGDAAIMTFLNAGNIELNSL